MKKKTLKRLSWMLAVSLLGIGIETFPAARPSVAADEIVFDKDLPEEPTDLRDGNYKLISDVKTPISIRDDAVVNLDLNGFTVDGGTLGSAITVGDDAKLCLYDTRGSGKITGRTGTRHSGVVGGAGVYVNDDATFEMYGGTITDCVVSSAECPVAGAGVYIKDGATFRMMGGTISKCRLIAPGGQYGMGAAVYGAGPIFIKDGLIEENGDFTVQGGGIYATRDLTISGNTVIRRNTGSEGGGVFLAVDDGSSSMDISGGTISGNSVTTAVKGGGVYVTAGGVRLSGTADISNQVADAEDIRFAPVEVGTTPDYRFCHQTPTKTGFTFELHAGSRTGTDVTDLYNSNSFKTLNIGGGFFVVWKYSGAPVVTSTPLPIPTFTATPVPTASATPTATPASSSEPVVSPSVSPSPGPGEGKDSPEYQALSEADRATADELVVREPSLSYVTAARMVTTASGMGVSKNELLLTDRTIKAYKSSSDPAGTTFRKLTARATKRTKDTVKLSWKTVSGADGYVVYGNTDDSKHALSLIKAVGSDTMSYKATGLKKGTSYKYLVIAYKNVDGERMTIAAGMLVHELTKGSKKKTTVKGLKLYEKKSDGKKKLESTSITLKMTSTKKLIAKEIPENSDLAIPFYREVRFESADTGVVKVKATKGKLTPVSPGKTTVYVFAQNGVYKKLTITVK